MAGTSRQVARFGVNINNLLPGMHDTKRLIDLDKALSKEKSISFQKLEIQEKILFRLDGMVQLKNLETPVLFFVPNMLGFIVGQNILLDGGAVNSTILR